MSVWTLFFFVKKLPKSSKICTRISNEILEVQAAELALFFFVKKLPKSSPNVLNKCQQFLIFISWFSIVL